MRAELLYVAKKETIRLNPNRIQVGTKLNMPRSGCLLIFALLLLSCTARYGNGGIGSKASNESAPKPYSLAPPTASAILYDSAERTLIAAIELFKKAADLGDIQSLEFLAGAHFFSIGVREEYLSTQDKIHLYYSVGSKLAADSSQAEVFLEKARSFEDGKSATEIAVMRKRVENWLLARPWLTSSIAAATNKDFNSALELQRTPPDVLVSSAHTKVKEAFHLFKQAADSGYLPAIQFVAKAYRYGIGVDGDFWMVVDGEYLYNSIGARLAKGTDLGKEFQIRVLVHEEGKPSQVKEKMREGVEKWFEDRPWIANGK